MKTVPSKKLKTDAKAISDRKKLLEVQLQQIDENIVKITQELIAEQKKTTTDKKKTTPKKATTKKVTKSPKRTPKKVLTETVATSRPKRQRKKSTVLKEAEDSDSGVELSPGLLACKGVLRTLMTHRYSRPFNVPVDPIALEIPDYPTIIKHPMDFGTIKQKLEAGQYEDISDFSGDVNLVFSNACTYNQPGSDVFVMAETLRNLFKKKIIPIEEKENTREEKSKQSEESTINELKKSIDTIRQEMSQLVEHKKSPKTTRKSRSPVKEKEKPPEPTPMTKMEMKQLSLTINSLAYEHLSTILSIIRKATSKVVPEDRDVMFDITILDTSTLRELETFVNSVKPQKKKNDIHPLIDLDNCKLKPLNGQEEVVNLDESSSDSDSSDSEDSSSEENSDSATSSDD